MCEDFCINHLDLPPCSWKQTYAKYDIALYYIYVILQNHTHAKNIGVLQCNGGISIVYATTEQKQ